VIRAYHVIFTAYGFWLPNDPRGSWSDFVGAWELAKCGAATTTNVRRSIAGIRHDCSQRALAKSSLKFAPVQFDGRQAVTIANGFRNAVDEGNYILWACAILPEHVHAVIARHERRVERIVGHLKGRATHSLYDCGLWNDPKRPVWAENCWQVFLNNATDIRCAVRYVENNPSRENKKRQRWSLVTPYL
jgi:REP element-mobilizing transposase RayT